VAAAASFDDDVVIVVRGGVDVDFGNKNVLSLPADKLAVFEASHASVFSCIDSGEGKAFPCGVKEEAAAVVVFEFESFCCFCCCVC